MNGAQVNACVISGTLTRVDIEFICNQKLSKGSVPECDATRLTLIGTNIRYPNVVVLPKFRCIL